MTGVAPGTTVVLGEAGSGQARTDLDAAIADGTLTGVAVDTLAADRGRHRRRGRVHRPRRRRAPVDHPARRRGARPGDGDRTRQPEAVCDVRRRRRSRATTSSRSVATRPRTARPTRVLGLGLQPLPAPGTWIAYDAASQMVHILGLAPGVDRPAAGPMDGLRRRAARQRGLRRRAPARRVHAERLGLRLQSRLPRVRQAADHGLRRRRDDGLDRRRVARVRLAAAGRHRRRPDGGPPLPADADPVPAPPRGRARRACS